MFVYLINLKILYFKNFILFRSSVQRIISGTIIQCFLFCVFVKNLKLISMIIYLCQEKPIPVLCVLKLYSNDFKLEMVNFQTEINSNPINSHHNYFPSNQFLLKLIPIRIISNLINSHLNQLHTNQFPSDHFLINHQFQFELFPIQSIPIR